MTNNSILVDLDKSTVECDGKIDLRIGQETTIVYVGEKNAV
jgi:hypothetical protein